MFLRKQKKTGVNFGKFFISVIFNIREERIMKNMKDWIIKAAVKIVLVIFLSIAFVLSALFIPSYPKDR